MSITQTKDITADETIADWVALDDRARPFFKGADFLVHTAVAMTGDGSGGYVETALQFPAGFMTKRYAEVQSCTMFTSSNSGTWGAIYTSFVSGGITSSTGQLMYIDAADTAMSFVSAGRDGIRTPIPIFAPHGPLISLVLRQDNVNLETHSWYCDLLVWNNFP